MSAITFDTLKYTKTLESAGISRAQAEAFAEATASLRVDPNGFATRDDVMQHEKEITTIQRDIGEIKKDIVEIKATMATKADMKDLELRLTVRLGAMIAAAMGIVVALIKLL